MSQKILKSYGLKTTLPRIKILQEIHSPSTKHFSAEDIYAGLIKKGEEINLTTVYRVLTQFEQVGLLIRHNFTEYDTKAVFELSGAKHHDHLICTVCGKIEEFYDDEIEKRQEDIASKHQYKMQNHALHIYGICPKCQ